MPIHIRRATEADVPAIRDIYNYEIENGWATFDLEPKSLEDRLEWFRETTHPHCIIVAEEDGVVLGWGALRPFRTKAAYRFTVENSVYIHQDQRGRSVGTLILTNLIELAHENGFHTIIARISGENPVSEHLHQSHGFTLVGTEREVGHKFERFIDVACWQLLLPSNP